jgi:WD40 repeat protein
VRSLEIKTRLVSGREHASFSPDGTLIAGASPTERGVKIWSVTDGTLVRTLPVTTDFQFPRVAFTPNGLFIVAVYGSSNTAGAIQFWRVENGRSVAIFAKPNHVLDIAFSPEPRVVCLHAVQRLRDGLVRALHSLGWGAYGRSSGDSREKVSAPPATGN